MIFLKNSDFCYKWSTDHIQQVFQISERSDEYSTRYGIFKSYPFGIALCSNLVTKCLIFPCLWVELCKTLENDGQEIKISTSMKKFHFLVKYAVFIKNVNEF